MKTAEQVLTQLNEFISSNNVPLLFLDKSLFDCFLPPACQHLSSLGDVVFSRSSQGFIFVEISFSQKTYPKILLENFSHYIDNNFLHWQILNRYSQLVIDKINQKQEVKLEELISIGNSF